MAILNYYPNIFWQATAAMYDVLLCIFLALQYRDASRQNHRFRILMYCVTISSCLDILRVVLEVNAFGFQIPYLVLRVAATVTHTSYGLITFYFVRYIESYAYKDGWRTLNHAIEGILLYVYLFLMVINLFVPVLVDVDYYTHTQYSKFLMLPVGYGIPFYFIISSGFVLIHHRKALRVRERYTLYFIYAVMIFSATLQAVFPNRIQIVYFLASLGLFLCFLSIETPNYRKLLSIRAQLEKAEKAAVEANRQKTDFLAAMSHEIRTPMAGVLGKDDLILRATRDSKIREYAENIHSAAETLLYIINDILDLSNIENGSFTLHEETYDLGKMLHDLDIIVRPRAEEKGLDFRIDVPEDLLERLFGDGVRVRQVILNVLNNAVKYTHSGSVSMSVRQQSLRNGIMRLRFTIRDTGIGIKEEDLPYLFTSFHRFDEKKNRHIEGSGLGLSIVKNLTDQMHGEVHVDSVYGVGSVFTIELPQKLSGSLTIREYRDMQRRELEMEGPEELIREAVGNVLVVDDNAMNRKVIRSLLLRTGLSVETAESGQECLNILKVHHFDIVLMDIMMPEMDGVETLHELRKLPDCGSGDLPVVALTANAIAGAKESYLKEGFDGYLSKPVNVEALEKMLLEKLPGMMCEEGGSHA